MRFKSYDRLHLFGVVARHLSFTRAADELNLTKGAVSYQVNRLEDELGFRLFSRLPRGLYLTEKGRRLLQISLPVLSDLEREISDLRDENPRHVIIGMSTYFASRWLSPRLMRFIAEHPQTGLRLQPMINLEDVQNQNVDMAIRWGNGQWNDMEIERLFICPAFPTAGCAIAGRVETAGVAAVLPDVPLLHDRDGSETWSNWHDVAGLPYRPARDDLVIPDPNVRVQAVIDDQGVALNDTLVSTEMNAGQLVRISDVELADFGYFLAYPKAALDSSGICAFRDWIMAEAGSDMP